MSDEIDIRISPSLHPKVVEELEDFEEMKDVLGATQTAFSTAYEGLRAVHNTREVVGKNPGWTAEQKLLQVDNFAKKHLDKITRTFDATRNNLERSITYLDGELSQPVQARAASTIANQIRDYARQLPSEKLHKFVADAIDSGDHDTVTAILGAPPYLSGLTADFQKTYLRLYHERSNPATAKRLKAMRAAKELIETRAGRVFIEMERAIGGQSSKANMVRKAQEAAEKALGGI
jgi:hypothetical protein